METKGNYLMFEKNQDSGFQEKILSLQPFSNS